MFVKFLSQSHHCRIFCYGNYEVVFLVFWFFFSTPNFVDILIGFSLRMLSHCGALLYMENVEWMLDINLPKSYGAVMDRGQGIFCFKLFTWFEARNCVLLYYFQCYY